MFMDIIDVSGILLTILGVMITGGATLHQYHKNKRLENRLERKEDLREFADSLPELNDWMVEFRDNLSNSAQGTSVWYDTRNFCKEYLSREQLGEDPRIRLSIFQYKEGGTRVSVDNPDEFIRTTKSKRVLL